MEPSNDAVTFFPFVLKCRPNPIFEKSSIKDSQPKKLPFQNTNKRKQKFLKDSIWFQSPKDQRKCRSWFTAWGNILFFTICLTPSCILNSLNKIVDLFSKGKTLSEKCFIANAKLMNMSLNKTMTPHLFLL